MESPEDSGRTDWRMPALHRFEWALLTLVGVGAAAVGAIGLYSSFTNVTTHMAEKGFENPALVPTAVDIAIPVFGLAYLLLIRLDMGLAWVRWVPYVLVGVTIYLNVTATPHLDAQVAHAALPSLWVAFTEVVAHFYRVQIGKAKGTRPDPIPLMRWLLAFPSTFRLWRLMQLWEITSYRTALDLERQRARSVTELRTRYGRRWRRNAPLDVRTELRLGALSPAQARGDAPLGSAAQEKAPVGSPAPSVPHQRELGDAEGQTALPLGAQTASLPEGDTPYSVASEPWSTTSPAPDSPVETRAEREEREERQRAQRRQDNYDKAVEVALEYVANGGKIVGERLAADERIPVGARSVQRYLNRMVEEGVIPADVIEKSTTKVHR